MRYQVGQKLWVMFAHVTNSNLYPLRVPYTPWNYGHVLPKLEFLELEVIAHHKVRNEYAQPDSEPDCDGFLLRDIHGNIWSNQYPLATYGQLTTSADQHFSRYFEDEKVEKELCDAAIAFEKSLAYSKETCDPNPLPLPILPEMHLFTSELNELSSGIFTMKEQGGNAKNLETLEKYYDHIIASFTEQTKSVITCSPLVFGGREIKGRFRHTIGETA